MSFFDYAEQFLRFGKLRMISTSFSNPEMG